jgi:cytidyltransferase-like protein
MEVVLAHGCFDLLHLGHIRHLQEARALGDWLVVSISTGHRSKRLQFTAQQRKEALLALSCVDEVWVNDTDSAVAAINALRPAVYVKGCDYAGNDDPVLKLEVAAIKAIGGRFCTTSGQKWSSTGLLRNIKLSDEALAYLETARARDFLPDILAAFERADKLKVAFVGETISDVYCYVRSIGKPSKEPILAVTSTHEEWYSGGVVAASQHAEWRNRRVVTSDWVIIKRRWVSEGTGRKLFEVYSDTDLSLDDDQASKLRKDLSNAERWADVIVVLDFGHGLMDTIDIDQLRRTPKFLAATAQSNAGNHGFNSVKKYMGVDYICVDEAEARLATGFQHGHIETPAWVMKDWADSIIITRNSHGALDVSSDPPTVVPAFILGGVDTMGAGDAFLAVTAPLVAAGLPLEQAAFVGNVAGGLKTGILGHREHVTRQDLVKNIEWLLK